VIVTDFHPVAASAGHRRTFRGVDGAVHEIEHYVHSRESHVEAARAVGLSLVDVSEAVVGEPVRELYTRHGRLQQFEDQLGLPLVLGLSFVRRDRGAGSWA
jgi:malonyl-CoA O-methyltransferase